MSTLLSQLSVALPSPVLPGLLEASHSIVTLSGQVTAGAVVSTTVIVWTQLELLPQSSVAFHVRVTVFSCAQLPASTLSL